ncbi:MAG: MaoC family dehydratase [Candidatus Izemoplasmatales bacterium]|nr:MaoC family dehydratase [Candidatus Izemoplasmatales bacterium]MDD3865139.1 MaoC family dehydratase [Candidatus Izemoplasmatales bacterium]
MNKIPFTDLHVGDSSHMTKQFTESDVLGFAKVTGDINPAHLDETYAATTMFKTRIVHGMLVGSLFSAIFGTELPGLGSIYVNQTLKFTKPVYLNDEITATVTVKELIFDRGRVVFDCVATNQNQEVVLIGEAVIIPPK